MKKVIYSIMTVIFITTIFMACTPKKNIVKYYDISTHTAFSIKEDAAGYTKGDTVIWEATGKAVIDSIMPNTGEKQDTIRYRYNDGNTIVRIASADGFVKGDSIVWSNGNRAVVDLVLHAK